MRQSRIMSLFETIGGTATGFVLSIGLQHVVCWWYALPLSASDNLGIIAAFTALSLARGYVWRRLCEKLHVRRPLTPFMHAVIEERYRQIEREGWSLAHDDGHVRGTLARAGASYLLHAGTESPALPHEWPWAREWWKPGGYRRDLIRGVALAVAEGERFDRNRGPVGVPAPLPRAVQEDRR